jgi:hypothetical protein
MVDEGRILNFGDYHEGNLYLRETAREKVKRLKKVRKKEDRMSNPLEDGKAWKEIIEIFENMVYIFERPSISRNQSSITNPLSLTARLFIKLHTAVNFPTAVNQHTAISVESSTRYSIELHHTKRLLDRCRSQQIPRHR